MDERHASTSSPHRKSPVLHRSATWTARSSPTSAPAQRQSQPDRPPKPGRLVLPPLRPLAGWPRQGSDDSGYWPPLRQHNHHPPSTPSAAGAIEDDISLIDCHVYLGSDAAARDRAALRRHGITHVLNCVGASCPNYFRAELSYKTLWLHDSPAEDITSVLYDAFDFIEGVRRRPMAAGRVLVHCVKGASRSAAIVTAYLMWRHALTFEEALRVVRTARPAADPNLGFAAQLMQIQRRVVRPVGTPGSTGGSVRVYRMAPHSPYDPMQLVPKSVEVGGENGGVLDSRGAFVVHHLPFGVYVWIGSNCESGMEVDGEKAARQVVRYEQVQGPIVTVREGAEPIGFWTALPGDRREIGENGVGKRRVVLYDLDYDIFRRAVKGRDSPSDLMLANSLEKSILGRGSGWSQLRRRFFSSGVKELVKAVVDCGRLDDEETLPRASVWSPESSTTPSPVSADTPSTLSTFSPNSSSSSDWYHLSPPRSDLSEEKSKDSLKSIAERRGSNAPSLLVLPPANDGQDKLSPSDVVRDWCLSPPFIAEFEVDQEETDFERQLTLAVSDEEDTEEHDNEFTHEHKVIYPTLYRWPYMDEVQEIHRGVLDSNSVFLLLAPDLRRSKEKILYVWVGKELGTDMTVGENKEHLNLDFISTKVFERLGLAADIPVQIINEGQEPEEFLNHLFSFHQVKESSLS